jgi:hypothetical protein
MTTYDCGVGKTRTTNQAVIKRVNQQIADDFLGKTGQSGDIAGAMDQVGDKYLKNIFEGLQLADRAGDAQNDWLQNMSVVEGRDALAKFLCGKDSGSGVTNGDNVVFGNDFIAELAKQHNADTWFKLDDTSESIGGISPEALLVDMRESQTKSDRLYAQNDSYFEEAQEAESMFNQAIGAGNLAEAQQHLETLQELSRIANTGKETHLSLMRRVDDNAEKIENAESSNPQQKSEAEGIKNDVDVAAGRIVENAQGIADKAEVALQALNAAQNSDAEDDDGVNWPQYQQRLSTLKADIEQTSTAATEAEQSFENVLGDLNRADSIPRAQALLRQLREKRDTFYNSVMANAAEQEYVANALVEEIATLPDSDEKAQFQAQLTEAQTGAAQQHTSVMQTYQALDSKLQGAEIRVSEMPEEAPSLSQEDLQAEIRSGVLTPFSTSEQIMAYQTATHDLMNTAISRGDYPAAVNYYETFIGNGYAFRLGSNAVSEAAEPLQEELTRARVELSKPAFAKRGQLTQQKTSLKGRLRQLPDGTEKTKAFDAVKSLDMKSTVGDYRRALARVTDLENEQ